MRTFALVAALVAGLLTLLALVLGGASFAGLTGETLVVVTSLVSVAVWLALAGLGVVVVVRCARLALGAGGDEGRALLWLRWWLLAVALVAVLTMLGLAFGAFAGCGPLWLASLLHWGGLAQSLVAWGAVFALPHVLRALASGRSELPTHGWGWAVLAGGVSYGLLGLVWLVAWLILRGNVDPAGYPLGSNDYRLPFPAGESSWVIQGNESNLNHEGDERHAWDFRRPCGSPVLAARAGTVRTVQDSNDGRGSDAPNNRIVVAHADGTTANYLHVRQGSAAVAVGDAVVRGQLLAEVGNVGKSLTGHVHFHVRDATGASLAVVFADVDDDDGIPRTFSSYTSGNTPAP